MTIRPLILLGATLAVSLPASADSFGNASQAAADSVEASARIVASGGQIALGAIAVPLAGSGALAEAGGEAATDISDALWTTANAPLTVDDRVVVAQPAPQVPRLPEGDE